MLNLSCIVDRRREAAVLQDKVALAERTDIMDVNECLTDFVATAPLVSPPRSRDDFALVAEPV